MTQPFLSVAASGYQGRGYVIPTRVGRDGKPLKVMGVTTALGALDRPGVLQWSIDNVAAYAAANVDALLSRTEEQGYGFLRFYHKRFKESDFDDPLKDVKNASSGVLNDLAELGTATHLWIEENLNGRFEPDIIRPEQEEMIEKFLEWKAQHDIEVVLSEATVVGPDYAGTLDHLLIIDGVPTLVDVKTSRRTRDEHVAQLAALGAAESLIREVAVGTPGAVEYKEKWWIEEAVPDFSEYAILHLRPSDWDNQGTYMEPFCTLKKIPQAKIDSAFKLFRAAVDARLAQNELKRVDKELAEAYN